MKILKEAITNNLSFLTTKSFRYNFMDKTETKRLYYSFVNKRGADTSPKCHEKWIVTVES